MRWLVAQTTGIDGTRVRFFAWVFGIFGHGNVTCLSEALEAVQDVLPTWRGQNEQSMSLAAIGFAKAKRRWQIMVATSSIGPGHVDATKYRALAVARDNGGCAVINRLQQFMDVPGFNNLLVDCRIRNAGNPLHVDFASHAAAMGAALRHCDSPSDLKAALEWARGNEQTKVLSIATGAHAWVPGGADWDVGVPEIHSREAVV